MTSPAAAQPPAVRPPGARSSAATAISAAPLTATSGPAGPAQDGTRERKYAGNTKCATPTTSRNTAKAAAAIACMPR